MSELQPSASAVDGKLKVERLFQFIRAFTNARNPIKRQLSEQPAADLQIEYLGLPNSSEWIDLWSDSEDIALNLMWQRLVQQDIWPTIDSSQELPTNTIHDDLLRISAQFRLEMAE